MKNLSIALFCALFIPFQIFAQQVSTLAKHAHIADGLYVSPDGKVFTTCGGLVQKNSIGMYSPETGSYELLTDKMRGSIDIASNDGNLLYTTNYDDNTVKVFNRKTGETTELAQDLDGSAGIEIDKDGNLYVTSFGAPPTYAGNKVWKISKTGEKEVLVESEELFRPQGIAWYNDSTLIVANSSNGKLFLVNVNTRKLSLFTNTNEKHGNIAMGRGKIFMASNRGHKILVLNRAGEIVQTFGDSTPTSVDGEISAANFVTPLGLAFSPDEKKLYVSQIGTGELRVIEFEN